MAISPLAGQPAPTELLIDGGRECHEHLPDLAGRTPICGRARTPGRCGAVFHVAEQ